MPRISIVTPDKVSAASGAYLDGEKHPIHLHRTSLAPGERMNIARQAADCVVYVWQGTVMAGGAQLASGSSAIVEAGEALAITSVTDAAVLTFAAAQPARHGRSGGHVHLLPADRVPKTAELSGSTGVGGGIHADGQCATCEVWLHENHFAPAPPMPPEQAAKGIHSHSEDEVIFITAGAIRLGQKLFPAGTAVAIAADTLYAIAPGPEGMSFINFRAGTPSDIRFASGMAISETDYWQQRLPQPAYLEADQRAETQQKSPLRTALASSSGGSLRQSRIMPSEPLTLR